MVRHETLSLWVTVIKITQTRTFLVALFLSVLASSLTNAFDSVVIDPGHGGSDEGTAWYHVKEKDAALAVALHLEKLLRKNEIECHMTRRTDTYVSLDDRAKAADRHPRSLLVSIHFNGSSVESSSGFAAYYFSASPSGKFIAQTLQDALDELHNTRNRGIHPQDYAVLVRTAGCAVLVECGFLSNKAESRLFSSPEGQEKLAEALLLGIMRAKPSTIEDPLETEIAKCEAYGKRIQEKEHKSKAAAARTKSSQRSAKKK